MRPRLTFDEIAARVETASLVASTPIGIALIVVLAVTGAGTRESFAAAGFLTLGWPLAKRRDASRPSTEPPPTPGSLPSGDSAPPSPPSSTS